MESYQFYSHGKLLLTGEYLVLDGAEALAIPCKFGQHLSVDGSTADVSTWLSYDYQNRIWLEIEFDLFKVIHHDLQGQNDIEKRLFQILREVNQLNAKVFTQNYNFKTHLEFPQNWGLGTSSTLIANLAKWAKVNPYELLNNTFGGSGYDIACADAESPLVYSINQGTPRLKPARIPYVIKPHSYFVHLGEKQNSRDAIANYRSTQPESLERFISKVNSITEEFQRVQSLERAEKLIQSHENILSEILKIDPVKSRLFPDFKGSIKSLGAWGGDFVMVLCHEDPSSYFKNKGYSTILPYTDMSL